MFKKVVALLADEDEVVPAAYVVSSVNEDLLYAIEQFEVVARDSDNVFKSHILDRVDQIKKYLA